MALIAALVLVCTTVAGCGSGDPTTRPVASEAPAVPSQHCGTLAGPGATFSILTGKVSCAEARQVFADLFAGRGTAKTAPDTGQTDREVDGWLCGGGAGGFGCSKGEESIAAAA